MSEKLEWLEQQLLGGLLGAESAGTNAATLLALAGVQPDDFTDARTRVAWRLATTLAERGRKLDSLTLYAAGLSTGDFVPADRAWLMTSETGTFVTREMFASVAESFRETVRRRRLLTELRRHVGALERGNVEATEVADALQPVLHGMGANLAETGTGADDVLELAESWEAQEQGKAKPLLVPTGIPAVDEAIGGLPPNLSIVCGLPSVGKSAALASMMDAQLSLGLRVGLVGLEDGSRWFAKRLMARDLGLPLHRVGSAPRTGELGQAWPEVAARLTERLRNVLTYKRSGIAAGDLVRLGTDWFLNRGVDVLYVDHGGEVDHAADTRQEDHRLRVARTYGLLRDLAVRVQRPVVVLAHTNRDSDDDEARPPRPKELAESAYIERRARLMFGLWARESEPDAMRLTVIKNTEGVKNITYRLQRFTSAALLDVTSAEVVNLESERREESKAKRLEKDREREELAARRKAEKEAQKAAATAARPTRQASLLPNEGRDDS